MNTNYFSLCKFVNSLDNMVNNYPNKIHFMHMNISYGQCLYFAAFQWSLPLLFEEEQHACFPLVPKDRQGDNWYLHQVHSWQWFTWGITLIMYSWVSLFLFNLFIFSLQQEKLFIQNSSKSFCFYSFLKKWQYHIN